MKTKEKNSRDSGSRQDQTRQMSPPAGLRLQTFLLRLADQGEVHTLLANMLRLALTIAWSTVTLGERLSRQKWFSFLFV